METKKSPKANLEKKRFLLLELGCIIALGICFAAFEWSSSDAEMSNLGPLTNQVTLEQDIQATFVQPPPPKFIPPEPNVIPEEINITEDSVTTDLSNFTTDPADGLNPIGIITIYKEVEEPKEAAEPIPFCKVEIKPIYPGGEKEMLKFITKNIKYPEIARQNNVDGIVYISFIIDVNGNVTNVGVSRSVDTSLDDEAARVVALMPAWSPGKQRTEKVPVSYIIPIKFKLY